MSGESTEIIVETAAGKVRGVREHGVAAFRGIPYGRDTSGANRFRPPRLPEPWSGVREATKYGSTAVQVRPRLIRTSRPIRCRSSHCLRAKTAWC